MISTSDECYRHFLKIKGLDGDGDPDLVGLFAYALVERERIDWIDHRETHGLGEPSLEAIREWYGQKPQSFFDEKLKQAASRFDLYARGYLVDDIEAAKAASARAAVGNLADEVALSKTEILSAIDGAKDKGGHWWRGGFQGAFGNLLFAIGVLAFLWLVAHPADLIAWGRTTFHL